MVYGYARVSTIKQANNGNSLVQQQEALRAVGVERIFTDVYTGSTTERPELSRLLDVLAAGDSLVVTKLDRLGRSVMECSQLIHNLVEKNITVNVLNVGVLAGHATGQLLVNILLAFSQFERQMIVERTQEGKAKARQNAGFRDGRPPLYNEHQLEHALGLLSSGLSYTEVAKRTKISKSTLIRAVNKRRC